MDSWYLFRVKVAQKGSSERDAATKEIFLKLAKGFKGVPMEQDDNC